MHLKPMGLVLVALSTLPAFPYPAVAEPPGVARALETLGAIRGEAATLDLDGALGQRAAARGASLEKLKRAFSRNHDVWLMPDGTVLYVDTMAPSLPRNETAVSSETRPLPVPDGYASSGLPLHHSLPGATNKIFLDFDGVVGFRSIFWRSIHRDLPGFDLDGAPQTFNAAEQSAISRVWARVAEDWAPFNVDVTTEEPAQLGGTVLWSIFTTTSAAGVPSNVAGIAPFIGGSLFGQIQPYPCFTFLDALGTTNDSALADTASHEQGHIFGLLHDGIDINGAHGEYYGGHGTGPTSWGPLMGAPFYRNVTQFSKGEYSYANNQEDDLAIIAADLGWRSDDFCNGLDQAPPLVLGQTYRIESPADVDVFELPMAIPPFGTEVALDITPFRADQGTDGGNLDVAADIVDAWGSVIATSDPVDATLVQRLTVTLPPGRQWYLRVRPSFAPGVYSTYGSLGQYAVTGLLPNQPPIPVARRQPLNCLPGQGSGL